MSLLSQTPVYEIFVSIIIPYLLAFSLVYGVARKWIDDKIAKVMGFVFGVFFIYYQNYVAVSQAFGAFIIYSLLALFMISLLTTLLLGKPISMASGLGLLVAVVVVISGLYFAGIYIPGLEQPSSQFNSIISQVVSNISIYDMVAVIVFIVLFLIIPWVLISEKEVKTKDITRQLGEKIAELLGLKESRQESSS